ncbi:MAG: D-alanyl-D-alanine carboxypeptidase/D-alanyl-D-alanine-endopeptidase [Alphaproteobacteria bacterium]|nr:D-alanyl-D-alanine carboxypeptidase/D-alanyl-D-alanine-endopeptidase [Alphaproteobacteria bacterium]
MPDRGARVLHGIAIGSLAGILLAACAAPQNEPPSASAAQTAAATAPPEKTVTPEPDAASAAAPKLEPAAPRVLVVAQGPSPSRDDMALITQYKLTPEQVGYVVFEAETGQVLAGRNADKGFIPASVVKLPTSVLALDVLGGEHQFATRLMATGAVQDGVLNGDLYLVGGGDPQLAPPQLARLVRKLKSEGVRRVAGRFFYDETYLVTREAIEPAQPEEAAYNPGVSALSLSYNRFQLRWRRGRAKAGVSALALAHSSRIEVPLEHVSLGQAPYRQNNWQKFDYVGQTKGDLPGPRWLISPRLGKRGSAWLPVKKPGAYAAHVLRRLAAHEEIMLPPPAPGAAPPAARLIDQYDSRLLLESVEDMLKFSNNLSAELMGLSATRKLAAQPLDLPQSAAVKTTWFRTRAPDVDWRGVRLANHSGLSTRSRISPAQMAAILRYATKRSYQGLNYQTLLPFKAWAGTETLPEPVLVWAKSGTMKYIRGLAGIAQLREERPLGFVIFLNDIPGRRAYDEDPKARVPWMVAKARNWMGRAKALEQALIRSWLQQFGKPREFVDAADRATVPKSQANM